MSASAKQNPGPDKKGVQGYAGGEAIRGVLGKGSQVDLFKRRKRVTIFIF